MQKFAKFIYFKLMGWTVSGDFPSHLDKCVIIVVPHTSWWDFLLGLIIRKVWNEEINYIGKKSLFDSPFGWFFRWTGGAPIDRSKNSDTVSATVKIFKERKKFRLALSPEGTRKKVEKWKTGFYYIAKQAEVPIVLVAFDFGKKEIKVSEPKWLTNNIETDFKTYAQFYEGVMGKTR
ncbi:1-acyl-sn-glycerol-3-phosphate acyltransferase [Maribacter sp. PR1]|uniref:1-acyl-sn-glycerol-3-phosphate acyltransferase n=1 Tax=Maribacter cobaltidurans TaxID=1178778 RepID=A0ABU7IWM4_9FLAO|nr:MULTISPECIES: 1-acyl-sn-glycerol-3-phosphate acyltransferase [Maribacter]MDC6389943.1 1-acyl-sn-glycerol-3-phosphate acyltransferase [Maribacter sp. PR1]MEE1977333.1 1-acyl-sn-glycerol-3-phosphate acyltransferase [Maribacter cobaltidurans]